jgi:hypothetical protein
MSKITKLTAEQEQRLLAFREEWRSVGLSCEPADYATGDEIIRDFYTQIGKPAPIILHFSSPMMCELALAWVTATVTDKPKKLWDQLRDQLWDQLGDQLGGQLRGQLWGQLRDQLGDQLWDQLRDQLWGQLWDQLRDQLGDQLGDQLQNAAFTGNAFWGQHDCAWTAFYLFCAEIGVQYPAGPLALLKKWGNLESSIGWWAPFEGICFVSDRPRRVSFDAERRLHSETGKAVEYSDGWGVSAWHGTRIPDDWVTDRKTLTPKLALTHSNIEQRRAAIGLLGWNSILHQLDGRMIDRDADPEIGELIEVDIPDVGRERFLRVRCGTGRGFALPVPPQMKTALEAQAWTWGHDTKTFATPEVRT